ncbi:MAG TPA: hypothetical protein DEB39_06805, partial [Planctomycetaceae bacterium]|nr:hypothetical protein [Planctomycetaceae bacterium]
MSFEFSDPEYHDPYLRVFPRAKPLLDHQDVPFFAGLPELLQSIRTLTNREVLFVRAGGTMPGNDVFHCPVRMDNRKTVGFLVLAPKTSKRRAAIDAKAERLVRTLADFLGDAYRWTYAVREMEESAASNVPLPEIAQPEEAFGKSLREQLKAAANLLDGAAAALYL